MARRWYSKKRRFARVWTYCACGHVVLTLIYVACGDLLDSFDIADSIAWAIGAVALFIFEEIGMPRSPWGAVIGITITVVANGAAYGLLEACAVQWIRKALPRLPSTDPWCAACGYDLRGRDQGAEPRCPECGEPCFYADASEQP